jgi:choline transporter-like protein 2/4/5
MTFDISEKDKQKHDAHLPLVSDGFEGTKDIDEREHTDVIFGFLLIVCWVAMTIIGAEAIRDGNPYILINGIDYKGRVCGVTDSVKDKPVYYPINTFGLGVCLEGCPQATQNITDFSKYICTDSVSNPESYAGSGGTCDITSGLLGQCECNIQIKSKKILNHCIFVDTDFLSIFTDDEGPHQGLLGRVFADVLGGKDYIFGFGIGVALLLAFGYAQMLKRSCFAHLVVWGSIMLVGFCLTYIGASMLMVANDWEDEEPQTKEGYEIKYARITAYVLIGFAVAYWLLMLAMRKRIELAIILTEQAAKALLDMPTLIFVPLFQAVGFVLFLLPWTFYVVYTASLGQMEIKTVDAGVVTYSYKVFHYDKDTLSRAWFLLFCLFWTSQFVISLGQLVNAMAVSTWYFTRDKKQVGNMTVINSIKVSMTYHLGTLAYGSLIIAIIQLVRTVIYYLQRKAKETGNKLAEIVLACLQCFMWCVEKCMKFINKNAYIQTAIFGHSFCKAARAAFFLILRNILRIGIVSVVSEFILIIGRIFVVCMTGALCFYFLSGAIDQGIETDVNNVLAPVLFAMILAYFTATMFCEIFSMAIDTMLQCFVADEEMFGPEERYAADDLAKCMDSHGGPLQEAVKEMRESVIGNDDIEEEDPFFDDLEGDEEMVEISNANASI